MLECAHLPRRYPARSDELLLTKLAPPRPHPSTLWRERLFVRLDQALERKIALIAAPPGFGKSTLVGEWAAARRKPIAWVSLDAGDDDPIRFWQYVIAACQTAGPALGKTALAALRSSQQPSFERILTAFLNEIAQLSAPLILVLDDYHVIASLEIHDTLAFLLDHLPPSLHLILITRGEPPLPLARLRARDELVELTATDLRFSRDEIQTLFHQVLKLPVSDESLARLVERTEGWAAGLRLIGLALESQPEQASAEKLLSTFPGEAHILDYLAGEVFASQTESVQAFLLRTSFLSRLSGALCDAVTGRQDSARVLEQLARSNLFLVPLGDQGAQPWYRYHALFAEALRRLARQRLGESERQSLFNAAAAAWFEAHGFLDQAVESSLAAGDYEHAAVWIERLVEQRGPSEIYTLRRWAEQLPSEVLDRHPAVGFTLAMALVFTEDRFSPATVARVEAPLHSAEQAWRAAKNDARLGQVFSLRATMLLWQGDFGRGFRFARESLELLSDDDANWRGNSLICAGVEELLAGDVASAQNRFIEARALCGAAQNIHGVLAALTLSANAYVAQGEFEQAAALYRQVLADAVGAEAMLDDQAAAHFGLATVAFETGDWTSVGEHAERAQELSVLRSNEQIQAEATLLLARLRHATGQAAPAQEMLQALIARVHQPRLLRLVLAWQGRFALAAGDLDAVQRWHASPARDDDLSRRQQEQETLLLARLHIAGGKPAAAIDVLQAWRTDARAHGRTRSEIEILCVKALAQFAQSDRERAKKTILRALALARPANARAVFVEEGEPMARLLQAVVSQIEKRPLAAYATVLLRTFAATQGPPPRATGSPLLEPLSAQEQRVLRLLGAGLSNPEIARELVVSTNTIKTQVQSIYRKLNVTNRSEAADMARQLKLL